MRRWLLTIPMGLLLMMSAAIADTGNKDGTTFEDAAGTTDFTIIAMTPSGGQQGYYIQTGGVICDKSIVSADAVGAAGAVSRVCVPGPPQQAVSWTVTLRCPGPPAMNITKTVVGNVVVSGNKATGYTTFSVLDNGGSTTLREKKKKDNSGN